MADRSPYRSTWKSGSACIEAFRFHKGREQSRPLSCMPCMFDSLEVKVLFQPSVAPASTAVGDLETVETWEHTLCRASQTGDRTGPRRPNGGMARGGSQTALRSRL